MTTKYQEASLMLLLLFIFSFIIIFTSEKVTSIDMISMSLEAIHAAIPILGMFIISSLKETYYKTFLYLLIGLSFISISFVCDTLDEAYKIKELFVIVVEDFFQIIGFALLLIGIKKWVDLNNIQTMRLENMATTDFLTKTSNRRSFLKNLKSKIKLVDTYPSKLSLILLDIDHFKNINDKYGHDTGDKVLVNLSDLVKKNIRKIDMFARIGGEEFILILPNTTVEKAYDIAIQIAKLIENAEICHSQKVTASFSVSQYKKDEKIAELLKRLDDGLYEAKDNGRNCVVLKEENN